MYPADQYNVSFFEEDLPDELKLNLYSDFELIDTLTAQKNTTQYGIYWWPFGDTSYALRHDGNTWGLYTQETPNIEDGFTDLGGPRCLIDDPDTTGLVVFEDNFEDTYTVTTPFGFGTVARESLCVWRGTDNNGCDLSLFYGGGGFEFISEAANKWAVSFSSYLEERGCETGYISIKDGFQNSPIGTHTDSVDTSVSATVS
jgi:hypothetical protein